ncbi:MAG: hypothetical protein COW18_13565, partial [Zetaproteobacteria bacterium CG12_big_fil_rev_8_21_14_0_65_54_13]
RLQPFRYLHDCSDCFRLEQKLPGGIFTHWDIAAFPRRTPQAAIRSSAVWSRLIKFIEEYTRNKYSLRAFIVSAFYSDGVRVANV